MLSGAIQFLGLAVGAVMGALTGKMQDYGISDQLINDIKSKVVSARSSARAEPRPNASLVVRLNLLAFTAD